MPLIDLPLEPGVDSPPPCLHFESRVTPRKGA